MTFELLMSWSRSCKTKRKVAKIQKIPKPSSKTPFEGPLQVFLTNLSEHIWQNWRETHVTRNGCFQCSTNRDRLELCHDHFEGIIWRSKRWSHRVKSGQPSRCCLFIWRSSGKLYSQWVWNRSWSRFVSLSNPVAIVAKETRLRCPLGMMNL